MNWVNVVRWVHVVAGISWLGEVLTINLVLVPALVSLNKEARRAFIHQVFPRVFRLASILSATAVISGLVLNYLMTGWTDLGALLRSRWGISILVGGSLGLLLTLFHFFVETRLEPTAHTADNISDSEVEKIVSVLNLVPKIGMLIIVVVVLLMMYAARGL
ncbi:MAG: hypothetical protein IT317_17790 [Anaerolineales bacterium]|nr:hypothetical protein [Anaerolineales bacterium]